MNSKIVSDKFMDKINYFYIVKIVDIYNLWLHIWCLISSFPLIQYIYIKYIFLQFLQVLILPEFTLLWGSFIYRSCKNDSSYINFPLKLTSWHICQNQKINTDTLQLTKLGIRISSFSTNTAIPGHNPEYHIAFRSGRFLFFPK